MIHEKGTRVEILWNRDWTGHRGYVVDEVPLDYGWTAIWVQLDGRDDQVSFYPHEVQPLSALLLLAEQAE